MEVAPVVMAPPAGTAYGYSPTVCVDTGAMGGSQIHVLAVANNSVYDSYATSSSQGPLHGLATEVASANACGPVDYRTMMGDETVHVVTLACTGHVTDIHGTAGGTWTTTDLGAF